MTPNHKPERCVSIVVLHLQLLLLTRLQRTRVKSRTGGWGRSWAACLTPTLSSVTLSKLFNSSVPQFPHKVVVRLG